jgi:hypothetical protein
VPYCTGGVAVRAGRKLEAVDSDGVDTSDNRSKSTGEGGKVTGVMTVGRQRRTRMDETPGQRMIELCLTMKIHKCRSEKRLNSCCNWDESHRTGRKAYRYVCVLGTIEDQKQATGRVP